VTAEEVGHPLAQPRGQLDQLLEVGLAAAPAVELGAQARDRGLEPLPRHGAVGSRVQVRDPLEHGELGTEGVGIHARGLYGA
jgi:hypothetical protein